MTTEIGLKPRIYHPKSSTFFTPFSCPEEQGNNPITHYSISYSAPQICIFYALQIYIKKAMSLSLQGADDHRQVFIMGVGE